MAYVIRADIIDEDLNVRSSHEFYGSTAREAQEELDEHLQRCEAMSEAENKDLLVIGEVEEISDDELPEVQEDAGDEVESAEIVDEG